MLRSTSRVRPAGAACKASWLLWMWTVDLRVTWSTAGPTGLRPGASSSRARLVVLCMLRRQANAEGGRERFSLGLKNLGRSRAQCATEATHLERTAGSVDLFFLRGQKRGWSAEGVDPMQGKATTSETTLALARAAATGRCVPAGPAPDKAATPTGVAMAHGGGAVVEPRVGGRPRAPRIL
jgi:hypothetical protein